MRTGKCIKCEVEIKELYPEWVADNMPPMWNSGMCGTIHAGYGSGYDLDNFKVFVCDNCIDKLVEQNIIERTQYEMGGGQRRKPKCQR
jgi:hypothetical protein